MSRPVWTQLLCAWAVILLAAVPLLGAENLLANPEFAGSGGALGGNATGTVPDNWRAFSVGDGGAASIAPVPLAADEVFPGSPATNAVQWQVEVFAADQAFDDDNSRFPVTPGLSYQGAFYAKTANDDGSDQVFNLGFPVFGEDGGYLGREPGSQGGLTATSEWTLFEGPLWSDPEATSAHVSFRVIDDGGPNGILLAFPQVTQIPEPTTLALAGIGLLAVGWCGRRSRR
jgi:hypothetical protein